MYKTLRILFCILAVICTAVTVFIFAYFKLWGFVPLGGAVIFAALMFLFKNKQEKDEAKLNPPAPKGDFITGKVNSEDNSDGEDNL